MISLWKTRHIIQAPSGTELSAIKPKLPKKSSMKPLQHRMFFGGRTYRYFVPNDGCEYFLYQRNQGPGIKADTLQEKLENEEWVVKDVLEFGEKVISEKPDKRRKKELQGITTPTEEFIVRDALNFGGKEMSRKKDKKLKKELKEKDQKISVLTRKVLDFGEEEEIFNQKEKKFKQELEEKDQKIAALTEQVKVKSQENETLQRILLQSLRQQVRRVRKEHLKRFQEEFGCKRKGQEEEFAQDMNNKFY